MKIFFVGYLKGHFIEQDKKLLEEDHQLTGAFDLYKNSSAFRQTPSYLIKSLKEWRNIWRSDVVWIWYADYPALPFIVLAKLFKKKIIINVGGWEVYSAPEISYGNQLNPIRGAVTRWILRNADRCIVMSNAYKKLINAVEPKAFVLVMPGWIDQKYCETPLPETKKGVVTALCTYRFTNVLKGIPVFKEATQGMDAKVIENIPHEDLMELLRHTKVYCQLSYTESFGMTLLEAMACGCVPVVTNRDALPEVVGDCGVVIPYGDVNATQHAIGFAMMMDGNNARERAKMFTKEKKQAQVNMMLSRLLPNKMQIQGRGVKNES